MQRRRVALQELLKQFLLMYLYYMSNFLFHKKVQSQRFAMCTTTVRAVSYSMKKQLYPKCSACIALCIKLSVFSVSVSLSFSKQLPMIWELCHSNAVAAILADCLKLALIQIRVESAFFQKLSMSALLNNISIFHNKDTVCITDR